MYICVRIYIYIHIYTNMNSVQRPSDKTPSFKG